MNAEPDRFDFPQLSDEAVLELERFLKDFYNGFQNHYFAQLHRLAQLHRHDHPGIPQRDPVNDQLSLPLQDDPPF